MSTIETDPEAIEPWYEIEPEYGMFQHQAWEHPESAHQLTVEDTPGPHGNRRPDFQVLLLAHNPDGTDELVAELETGLNSISSAAREAEALMVTNSVYDGVNQ